MNMKKKIYILAISLVAIAVCLQAQVSSFLTVTYVEGSPSSEEFSVEGGEIQILDNTVNVVFPSNPEQNKNYSFDEISSLKFEKKLFTGNIDYNVPLALYIDKAGILHLNASESLGLVNVYSIAGVLVATTNSNSTEVCIDLGKIFPGVYFVKTRNQTVKFVK